MKSVTFFHILLNWCATMSLMVLIILAIIVQQHKTRVWYVLQLYNDMKDLIKFQLSWQMKCENVLIDYSAKNVHTSKVVENFYKKKLDRFLRLILLYCIDDAYNLMIIFQLFWVFFWIMFWRFSSYSQRFHTFIIKKHLTHLIKKLSRTYEKHTSIMCTLHILPTRNLEDTKKEMNKNKTTAVSQQCSYFAFLSISNCIKVII